LIFKVATHFFLKHRFYPRSHYSQALCLLLVNLRCWRELNWIISNLASLSHHNWLYRLPLNSVYIGLC